MRYGSKRDADGELVLESYLQVTILVHKTMEQALAFHMVNKLSSPTFSNTLLYNLVVDVFKHRSISQEIRSNYSSKETVNIWHTILKKGNGIPQDLAESQDDLGFTNRRRTSASIVPTRCTNNFNIYILKSIYNHGAYRLIYAAYKLTQHIKFQQLQNSIILPHAAYIIIHDSLLTTHIGNILLQGLQHPILSELRAHYTQPLQCRIRVSLGGGVPGVTHAGRRDWQAALKEQTGRKNGSVLMTQGEWQACNAARSYGRQIARL